MIAWWFGSALAAPVSLPLPPGRPAQLEVTVLDEARSVQGLQVVVEGVVTALTNERGLARLSVDPGRSFVQITQGTDLVAEVDLVALAGESLVVRVVRERGEAARVDLAESSDHRGAIVGKVLEVDGRTPVAGAVLRFGARTTRSNRDGSYAMELPAGDYSLVVEPRDGPGWRVEHVRAVPDHRVLADVEILPEGVQLRHYEVVGPYVEGDISRERAEVRQVTSVDEAWATERIAATGQLTVADTLDQVPGVTVELGRYVFLRGQPSRYTTMTFNGSPLPSPEPLTNNLMPLDVLPAGILSSLEVQRGYSVDRPAGFGTGAVDLRTVRLPEKPFLDITLSSAVVSESTWASGNTYIGGRRDFFGFDDGRRALPDLFAQSVPIDQLPEGRQDELARSFSPFLAVQRRTLPIDFGASMTAGGRARVGRGSLGVVGAVTFRNRWRNQYRSENVFRNYYRFGRGGPSIEPDRRFRNEDRTDNDIDLTGVLAINGRFRNHTVSLNTLYVHLAQQRAADIFSFPQFGGYYGGYDEYEETTGFQESFLLSWVERELVAQQITSRHDLGRLRVDTRAMLARSARDAPDRRTYGFEERRFTQTDPTYGNQFSTFRRVPTDDGLLRTFETVADRIASFGVDTSLAIADPVDRYLGVVLKAGVSGQARNRTSITRRYQWRSTEPVVDPYDFGDGYYYGFYGNAVDNLYDPDNTGRGLDFTDLSRVDPDDVAGRERAIGGYGLVDVRVGDRVELEGGLRFESAFGEVRSFRQFSSEPTSIGSSWRQRRFCLGKPDCGLYPSASAMVVPLDDMRVLFAYGRSTARPNLQEMGAGSFVEPESGETLFGTQNLRPTVIEGLDLSWTWDPSPDTGVRVGGFLRRYRDPVERVHFNDDINDFTGSFANLGSSQTVGFEAGGRGRLGSFYALGDVVLAQNAITTSQFVRPVRPLDDQMTYTLDVQGGYLRKAHDVGLMVDIVGRRLRRATSQGRDYVFLQPIPKVALYWTWDAYQSETTVGGLQVRLENLPDPVWRFIESPDFTLDPVQDIVWRDYRRGFALSATLTFGAR